MMKIYNNPRTVFSLLAIAALSTSGLCAQSTNSNSVPPRIPPQPPPPLLPPGPAGGPMALLTLAERQQLKAAHDKAMQQDPSLESKMQALRKEMDDLRKAMRDAMIKADPTVEPILEKIAPSKRAWGGAPPSANSATNTVVMTNAVAMATPNAKARGIPPGFATLSPAEQQQIEALHEKVKTDPAVLAARNTLMQATTPETRRAAFEGLHQAIHDAMIKADPSIEGLLEKLHPGGVPPPPLPPQPPPQ